MRTLLNIIWVITGGIWLSLGYFFFGLLACVLVVTIPAGVASFRMANYALWPFGRTVVEKPGAGAMSGLSNVMWFFVAGCGAYRYGGGAGRHHHWHSAGHCEREDDPGDVLSVRQGDCQLTLDGLPPGRHLKPSG